MTTKAPAKLERAPTAAVRAHGAWALYDGIPAEILDEACAALSPEAKYSQAYKEKRWDGMIRLWKADRFPLGLLPDVLAACAAADILVEVEKANNEQNVDLSRFDDGYLPGITLYSHQVEAVRALLTARSGIVRSPTGSGKGEMIVAAARYLWEEFGWRTLIVTPKKGLAHQTYLRLKKYIGTDIAVGLLGDGKRIPGNIVAATAQTLQSAWPRERQSDFGVTLMPVDTMVRDIIAKFEVVIGDECHHASSMTWSNVFMLSNAKCRYGFSGTPLKNNDIADMTLKAVTGPMLYAVGSTALIDTGVIAKPRIAFVCADNASSPPLVSKPRLLFIRGQKIVVRNQGKYQDIYRTSVVESVYHNAAVVRSALWMADRGRKVLVICRQKAHWRTLHAAFTASGVEFLSLWGATKVSERERAKNLINAGKISILLASTIFDEGEDAPGIDALVLAEGVKANTNVIQRIGRALRKKKTGENVAWIVDIVPLAAKKLIDHAHQRCRLYEGEGYEVRLVESWPKKDDKEDPVGMLPFETWK